MDKMTKRLEDAVTKLYTAFHNRELDPFDCKACAVGNIVGHANWDGWFRPLHVNNIMGCSNLYPKDHDYSPKELKKVELIFLGQWEGVGRSQKYDRERQFKGLCAVVEYLCELDNVPNVMEIQSLFETEKDGSPVRELEEVLI